MQRNLEEISIKNVHEDRNNSTRKIVRSNDSSIISLKEIEEKETPTIIYSNKNEACANIFPYLNAINPKDLFRNMCQGKFKYYLKRYR